MFSIKTILLYLIFLLNINSVFSQTINDIYINGNYNNTPLIDIFSEIENANPVHFNYIYQQVEGIKVSVQFNQKSIPEALELILQNTGLAFSIRGDKNIVIHKASKKKSSSTGDGRITKSKKYWVEIYDNFKLKGSVLAPGVKDADDGIRVGDEVIVIKNYIFCAVGVAQMNGEEMKKSSYGEAVKVRHIYNLD